MNELEQIKKEKEGYSVVLPPPAQVYSPPNNDMSWTGLPEFADDTITDYSRPSPSIESNSSDLQNGNSSISEHGESSESIMSKPMIKFVKAADSLTVIKTNKVETVRKPSVNTQEFTDEIGEMRAISGHMLGAVRVQIPENNLNDLHLLREEDGTLETLDSSGLLGSLLLALIDLLILYFLAGTLVLNLLGCDPLALVVMFTPVEDNRGLLETMFKEEASFVFLFPDDVADSENLTFCPCSLVSQPLD
nr:hypothetical protein [Tanacetum cinerariifolium]